MAAIASAIKFQTKHHNFLKFNTIKIISCTQITLIKLFVSHGIFSRARSKLVLVCIWREPFLFGSEALRT